MEKCKVKGCNNGAAYEVILYDFYASGEVFFEQDDTCLFICTEHAIQNEREADGTREPKGSMTYPYTNRNCAQGFTIYKPI